MWLAKLFICVGAWNLAPSPPTTTRPAARVVPIDWSRFDRSAPLAAETKRAARLLNTCLRYNLAWVEQFHQRSADGSAYLLKGMKEHDVRMPASVAVAGAIALKTGIYDEKLTGLPREEARARVVRAIRGVAGTHRVNGQGAVWGDGWQTALWATAAGHAAWCLWDELDDNTREISARMVEFEADRFIRPHYQVPYWNGVGGDTKAEENAWNAMVHQLAVAMMPAHPHVASWKRVGSELMISAYAAEDDWKSNTTLIDGKPVNEWLRGYNLRADGTVVNHKIIHDDYMCCIILNLRAYLTQPLAGQMVSEAARFNADRVYRTMVTTEWKAPPYQPPGGTMYIPGKPEVYYPEGTDWSNFRFDLFYCTDLFIDRLRLDRGWPRRAAEWLPLRGERLEQMLARHSDGHLYDRGEFDTYRGAEQEAAWMLADGFLIAWLADHQALNRTGNWNAP